MASELESSASGAAARVFDTFELLEKILIGIRTLQPGQASRNSWCSYYHYQEVKALFRLQMVNTTFRDTIARSKTLRRNMYKEPVRSEGVRADAQVHHEQDKHMLVYDANPLVGWFSKLLSVTECLVYDDSLKEPDNFRIAPHVTVQDAIKNRPTFASWRNLLVVNDAKLCSTRVRLIVQWHGYRSKPYNLELEQSATLGELADKVIEAVNDHVGKMKENPDPEL